MSNRREFLKNAALLAGSMGALPALPRGLARALEIDPAPGSTWKDAEHVVILMQENRSFDHAYGALRGVRGFNDPRAITLPSGLPVWFQAASDGKTYVPFHLDIRNSNSTWTSYLPHSRGAEVAAFNRGKYDQWVPVMKSQVKKYAGLPLTLGYYDRRDIPFYYALADSFTICDQHFCSAMTSTTPNRCYLWSGMSQGPHDRGPRMANSQIDHDTNVSWTTFPERLEEHGITWRVYQNQINAIARHIGKTKDGWLGNYGDNPLEYFSQYQVELAAKPEELKKLSPRERALHERAFTTNRRDPNQHELTSLTYRDSQEERRVSVPKGDVFHQFRQDVNEGKLPAVSWLVAPANFSDHPSAPWYGAWYVSEALNILTQNSAVWRKTIFILTYDENDGYFDHVPPFVPPRAGDTSTGAVSPGIDTTREFDGTRPIGLGYRVPLVVASPWTRGGCVCSQVFDHTSVVQFLELFASHQAGKPVNEPNISSWRRAVCGDLTSVFQADAPSATPLPKPVVAEKFVAAVHQAQFRPQPEPGKPLSLEELEQLRGNPRAGRALLKQEPGTRASCALPYQLRVTSELARDAKTISLTFAAKKEIFGERAAGAPFNVYAPVKYGSEAYTLWSYAAQAGEQVTGAWRVEDFENGIYHLRVYGPNGFYREYRGDLSDPALAESCDLEMVSGKATGNLVLTLTHTGKAGPLSLTISDHSYGAAPQTKKLAAGESTRLVLELKKSYRWYDFGIVVAGGSNFLRRFAGRVETGELGVSDPAMARLEASTPDTATPSSRT